MTGAGNELQTDGAAHRKEERYGDDQRKAEQRCDEECVNLHGVERHKVRVAVAGTGLSLNRIFHQDLHIANTDNSTATVQEQRKLAQIRVHSHQPSKHNNKNNNSTTFI